MVFVENGEVWTYSCQILQGDFYMAVSITLIMWFSGFDVGTGDLYLKYIWKVCVGVCCNKCPVRGLFGILYQFGRLALMCRILSVLRLSVSWMRFREKYGDQLGICGKSRLIQLYCVMKAIKSGMPVLMKIPWDKLEKGREALSRSSQPQTRPSS